MSLPYYTMYPKDFDADEKVRLMGLLELGLYLVCLNSAWVNDGLPEKEVDIRILAKAPEREFQKAWPRVAVCFPLAEDGRRRNPRQEAERCKAKEKSQKASDSVRSKNVRSTFVDRSIRDTRYGSISDSVSVEVSEEKKDREVSEIWAEAEFDGPEAFDVWWQSLVGGHPNPNRGPVARTRLLEFILAGKFQRIAFQSGYEAHRASWDASFEPNLFDFVSERRWELQPRPKPQQARRKTQSELLIEEAERMMQNSC